MASQTPQRRCIEVVEARAGTGCMYGGLREARCYMLPVTTEVIQEGNVLGLPDRVGYAPRSFEEHRHHRQLLDSYCCRHLAISEQTRIETGVQCALQPRL